MTFYELEKACKKRRLKRVLFFVAGVIILVAVVLVGLTFNKSNENSKPNQQPQTSFEKDLNTDMDIQIDTKKDDLKEINAIKSQENNITKLQENNTSNFEINKTKTLPKKLIKMPDVKIPVENRFVLTPIIEIPKPEPETHKPINTLIKKETNKTKVVPKPTPAPANLIVTKTITYDFAIKKAKEYYKKEEYKKAITWAKKANNQDQFKKDSWIITAKSLAKLGDKKQAVKILQIYFDYSHDKEILKVLNEINSSVN